MSEKKEHRWENPVGIYIPSFMNNRQLNPVYVEGLEDSMCKDGFLPTFPIVCFRRADLPYFDDYTSELYICACGVHRTTAAQNLKLDKVYVDLRTGTMDDFIETMHTDNFQFDPALDTSLGQLFTKKEKREACKQLLLLPKYLKLTNVALADMWHTSAKAISAAGVKKSHRQLTKTPIQSIFVRKNGSRRLKRFSSPLCVKPSRATLYISAQKRKIPMANGIIIGVSKGRLTLLRGWSGKASFRIVSMSTRLKRYQ